MLLPPSPKQQHVYKALLLQQVQFNSPHVDRDSPAVDLLPLVSLALLPQAHVPQTFPSPACAPCSPHSHCVHPTWASHHNKDSEIRKNHLAPCRKKAACSLSLWLQKLPTCSQGDRSNLQNPGPALEGTWRSMDLSRGNSYPD